LGGGACNQREQLFYDCRGIGSEFFVRKTEDAITTKYCIDLFFLVRCLNLRQLVHGAVEFDQYLPSQVGKVEHALTDIRLSAKVGAFAIEFTQQLPKSLLVRRLVLPQYARAICGAAVVFAPILTVCGGPT